MDENPYKSPTSAAAKGRTIWRKLLGAVFITASFLSLFAGFWALFIMYWWYYMPVQPGWYASPPLSSPIPAPKSFYIGFALAMAVVTGVLLFLARMCLRKPR